MKQNTITSMVFRKEHTRDEIIHYIVDPDAPGLYLNVRMWHVGARIAWVALNVIATLYSCLLLILQSMPEFYSEARDGGALVLDWSGISELLCVIYFTIDYGLRFIYSKAKWWRFMIDANNFVDLLTTVPYYIQLIISASGGSAEGFRVIFLLRTFRIIKLARFHPMLHSVLQTMSISLDLLILFVVMICMVVIFASTAFFYAERTRWDPVRSVWMRDCPTYKLGTCENGTEEVSPYQSIPEAMYWAVVTITTVGFRLETPSSVIGKIVAVVTSLLGVLFFAAPATVLATNFKLVRRSALTAKAFKRLDMRITKAMLAQEKLKRELQLAHAHRSAKAGNVKVYTKRILREVARFDFMGVNRPIYEVMKECLYVYQPIVVMDRHPDGSLRIVDDFNPTTAQRVLTYLVVLDTPECRQAARASLESHGIISTNSAECDVLVTADPLADLTVRLDCASSYPELNDVVKIDQLENPQGFMQDVIPIRFVVEMPHLFPTTQVVKLLNECRLVVTVLNKLVVEEVDVPLPVDIVMASRFVRELSEIAYHRRSDNALIAYIHSSDAAELLKDFSKQFFPTADSEVLLLDGYIVDQQVLLAMMTSFPLVKLSMVPTEAANAFYRGAHLSVDLSEEKLIEVNLTALSAFDELGFGHRFRVQVPVCRVERTDVQFQLV